MIIKRFLFKDVDALEQNRDIRYSCDKSNVITYHKSIEGKWCKWFSGSKCILLLGERRAGSLGRIERLNKVNISIVERRPTKKSSVLAQSAGATRENSMHRRLRRCSCTLRSSNPRSLDPSIHEYNYIAIESLESNSFLISLYIELSRN